MSGSADTAAHALLAAARKNRLSTSLVAHRAASSPATNAPASGSVRLSSDALTDPHGWIVNTSSAPRLAHAPISAFIARPGRTIRTRDVNVTRAGQKKRFPLT